MRKNVLIFLILILATTINAGKNINRVRFMPDMPSPYLLRDWKQVAKEYDELVFSFQEKGLHFPIIKWDDRGINYKERSFSMVSYIGAPGGDEGINNLAAIVGASLAGVDKSNQQGHNFVKMCQKWYSSDNGINLYGNGISSDKNWNRIKDWYASLPNILAFQLNYLYPDEKYFPSQIIAIADFYAEIAGKLESDDQNAIKDPNMQRDLGAAVAWIEYMAYKITGEQKYLIAADKGIQYLLRSNVNPLYEMLLPYGAFVAARMNAELGRDYDITRLLNWCFDGDALPRHGWGVIADRWNGYDMHGLQGSITDGDGYAFAMNTFQMVGALAPLVRYDKDFAHDIGKWILNAANNCRMFYPDAYGPLNQSNPKWSSTYDKKSVIAYEGIRKFKRGWSQAIADYKTIQGKIVSGDYKSTHFKKEIPVLTQDIIETKTSEGNKLEHIWQMDIPAGIPDRWLVIQAQIEGEKNDNSFVFSVSDKPDGDYIEIKELTKMHHPEKAIYAAIPREFSKLYVKVKSKNNTIERTPDKLKVDALGITYKSDVSPFATGDFVVSFVDLIENFTVPIVAYRPEDAATDLGLYGSSHVGILGGIIKPTDIEGILQLDLLKTDYYHEDAYPTYLYYNPYDKDKDVTIDLGTGKFDIYNTVSSGFMAKNVSGKTYVKLPDKSASVLVIIPVGSQLSRSGNKTLANGIVIDYGTI